MPINTPPVLAGQSRSSEPEIAKAQETMASVFEREQVARADASATLQDKVDAGEDVQLHVYKNRLPSCHYVFKDGSQATFVNHEFKTANEYEIAQLDKEVKLNHPHIYIDKANAVISKKLDADPMAALREKIRAEILAEQQPKDMGSNIVQDGTQLKPSSTADIAPASANGIAQPMPQSLMAALAKNQPTGL